MALKTSDPYMGWLGGNGKGKRKNKEQFTRVLVQDEFGDFVVGREPSASYTPPLRPLPSRTAVSREPSVNSTAGKLPSQYVAEALDPTYPHKTKDHWLYLSVWNLIQRHRRLMGKPCPPEPVFCYATLNKQAR